MEQLTDVNGINTTPHGDGNDPSLTRRRKKKTFYFQRDSLKKRNNLLVGKEGSRRRQRYDNAQFTHHPCAVLYEDDLYSPGYHPTKEALWSQPEIAAWFLDMNDDDDCFFSMNTTYVADDITQQYTTISHRTHQDLKRKHVPSGFVFHYERALNDFITHGGSNSNLDPNYSRAFEVNNPFDRFVIHTMCRFHGIESYSKIPYTFLSSFTLIYTIYTLLFFFAPSSH
ncbi:hypothetical protein BCR42DRAFT_413066 [Absidia repens]|uniref:R3H-associated N-terminal domain-containing protein n=1 Tax=Absidia repens TaxID=90262 RepID=A0A1X2IKL9_9FUNG|nr:hypothetical protein BCR42DRAFT_413066 [Absidia repens]